MKKVYIHAYWFTHIISDHPDEKTKQTKQNDEIYPLI